MSYVIHEENQNAKHLLHHCGDMKKEIGKLNMRIANLSGKNLDVASPDELENLIMLQRAAVKSTERAIQFYEQRKSNAIEDLRAQRLENGNSAFPQTPTPGT